MPHSYTQTHVHLVFSTKERQKLISKELQPRLWAYVAAICKNQNMPALSIGGITYTFSFVCLRPSRWSGP
jgi:REP element-mobilizing transposase RayT